VKWWDLYEKCYISCPLTKWRFNICSAHTSKEMTLALRDLTRLYRWKCISQTVGHNTTTCKLHGLYILCNTNVKHLEIDLQYDVIKEKVLWWQVIVFIWVLNWSKFIGVDVKYGSRGIKSFSLNIYIVGVVFFWVLHSFCSILWTLVNFS